ncbi:fructose PTS transporter subunit IIA [Natroniella acetigena]|uniref:PTS sugar transporter subunit IIA n=1 Tax=Natroniella acetigena TaxID=52004 RepID=UPI00200A44D7|nr:fructose PTS transporter subunit IIA [Natroniella acetigena]MCK8828289.1 fructose PTS transporter subunit IIA [Natroniella acetigena]
MKLTELLTEDLIKLNLEGKDKEACLKELVTLLAEAGKITEQEEFYQTILAREELSTTGVGNQVAIPHGKSEVVKEPTIVFAKSETGVDYGSIDDQDVKLFFMIAVPEKKSEEHLKVLAKLSRKLMHQEFREDLLTAATKQKVLEVIKEHE